MKFPAQIIAIIAVVLATVMQWIASLALVAYYKTAKIDGHDYEKALKDATEPVNWLKSKMGAR